MPMCRTPNPLAWLLFSVKVTPTRKVINCLRCNDDAQLPCGRSPLLSSYSPCFTHRVYITFGLVGGRAISASDGECHARNCYRNGEIRFHHWGYRPHTLGDV